MRIRGTLQPWEHVQCESQAPWMFCSGKPVPDAMIAQGTSAGGGWFGINQVTARRLLKLKILFVLVCVFNFLSCNMAHSDIFKQWTYEMEPNLAPSAECRQGLLVLPLASSRCG